MQVMLPKGKEFALSYKSIPEVYVMQPGMRIKLNNQIKILAAQLTVQQLMDLILSEQRGIAIAVNHVVIQRFNWPDHQLNEDDEVLIIKATQGG
jgi:sulfur carrier protein